MGSPETVRTAVRHVIETLPTGACKSVSQQQFQPLSQV